MPVEIFDVAPQGAGDFAGSKVAGTGAVANVSQGAVGYFSGIFPINPYDDGWMGRFEISVPNGATIVSAKLATYQNTAGGPVNRMIGGLLAPDGDWNALGGTFSASTYPTLADLPWPESGFGVASNPARWHGSSPAFSLVTFDAAMGGTLMTWGEGTPVDNAVTGLVAKLQSWLDTYGGSLRSGSASGTDLPVALCWYREYVNPSTSQQFTIASSTEANATRRPQLTIEWEVVNVPSSVGGLGRVRPAARGLAGTFPAVRGFGAHLRPAPGGRARTR